MLLKLLTEVVGTFVHLAAILITDNPIAIGVSLATVFYIGSKVSGAHVNPVVSLAEYFNNKLDFNTLVGYILAQSLGAILALMYRNLYPNECHTGRNEACD